MTQSRGLRSEGFGHVLARPHCRRAARRQLHAELADPRNIAVMPANDRGGELRLPRLPGCLDHVGGPIGTYRIDDRSFGSGGAESFSPVCNEGVARILR